MYKDIVTVSTVAFHAEWGDKERNLNRILGYMEAAAKKGSDILVMPEMALTSYDDEEDVPVEKKMQHLLAETVPGPTSDIVSAKAKELGCNKIALGHHKSDVIETTLMAMLYGGQVQGMLPKLNSTNFENMQLIRPMYCILEEDILRWKEYNGLDFIACACRFTERTETGETPDFSARKRVKELIKELKKENPNVEQSIFQSIQTVQLDTLVEYKKGGVEHSFLERFTKEKE